MRLNKVPESGLYITPTKGVILIKGLIIFVFCDIVVRSKGTQCWLPAASWGASQP